MPARKGGPPSGVRKKKGGGLKANSHAVEEEMHNRNLPLGSHCSATRLAPLARPHACLSYCGNDLREMESLPLHATAELASWLAAG